MTKPVDAREVGQRVLNALGLGDMRGVTKLEITIEADQAPGVTVTTVVFNDGNLAETLSRFTLVPRE